MIEDELFASAVSSNVGDSSKHDPVRNIRNVMALLTSVDTQFNGDAVQSDMQSPVNDWTPMLQSYVYGISQQCIRYYRIHSAMALRYQSFHDQITLLIILLPFLMAVISFVPIILRVFLTHDAASLNTTSTIFHFIVSVLGIITTALGTLNKDRQYSDKANMHRIAANKFIQLSNSVEEQRLVPLRQRSKGLQFVHWLKETFYKIFDVIPAPDAKINEKINAQLKQTNSYFNFDFLSDMNHTAAVVIDPAGEPPVAPVVVVTAPDGGGGGTEDGSSPPENASRPMHGEHGETGVQADVQDNNSTSVTPQETQGANGDDGALTPEQQLLRNQMAMANRLMMKIPTPMFAPDGDFMFSDTAKK